MFTQRLVQECLTATLIMKAKTSAQVIVDRRMDRQTVMHLFLDNKRKRNTYVCNNRGASEKHIKRKKPYTRVYT